MRKLEALQLEIPELLKPEPIVNEQSIIINFTPANREMNSLLLKLNNGEAITEEEQQQIIDYYNSEQFRTAWERLRQFSKESAERIRRLQTAYEQLNDLGQEKVAEHAEMIAKIQEYRNNASRIMGNSSNPLKNEQKS